jgi:hypothetical protein
VFVCSCVVCCCDCVVLGFVCPYSSVVEHPLSKRKVGSSILLGGISLCYTHRLRLVFNTKSIALFCLSIITTHTHDTTGLNYKSFTLHCNVYKYEQQQRVLNSAQAFLRIQTPTFQLLFWFPSHTHRTTIYQRPITHCIPYQTHRTARLISHLIRRLVAIYTAHQSDPHSPSCISYGRCFSDHILNFKNQASHR